MACGKEGNILIELTNMKRKMYEIHQMRHQAISSSEH